MFRIKEYPDGWVVEIQKRKWWGKRYWTHYISVYGMESEPWYHSSIEYAVMSLLSRIEDDTVICRINKKD